MILARSPSRGRSIWFGIWRRRKRFWRTSAPKITRTAATLGNSLCGGEADFQAGAALRAVAGGDGAAVLRDDAFGDRQAESGAVRVETRGHEGVEDIRQHVRGDTLAVVLHGQHDRCTAVALLAAGANFDATRAVRSDGIQG